MCGNCRVEPIEKTASAEELETTTVAHLAIFGMGCPTCAARVRNSLLTVHGVSEAEVDHTAGRGKVVFAPRLTTIDAVVDAVTQAGNDGRHEYWAVPLDQSQVF